MGCNQGTFTKQSLGLIGRTKWTSWLSSIAKSLVSDRRTYVFVRVCDFDRDTVYINHSNEGISQGSIKK